MKRYREPIWMPVADWMGEHEKWVTIPASTVIYVRFGVLAFVLAWMLALAAVFGEQDRRRDARP